MTEASGLAPGRFEPAARAWFAVAVAINLLVVFWPAVPVGGPALLPYADKVAHVVVFAAVVWAGRRAWLPLLPLVVLLAGHGVESELVQHFLLPARSGDILDTGADLLGVVAGCVLPCSRVAVRLTV